MLSAPTGHNIIARCEAPGWNVRTNQALKERHNILYPVTDLNEKYPKEEYTSAGLFLRGFHLVYVYRAMGTFAVFFTDCQHFFNPAKHVKSGY